MHVSHDEPVSLDLVSADDGEYDPPIITDLGSLAELTAGPATGVEDGFSGQGGDGSGVF